MEKLLPKNKAEKLFESFKTYTSSHDYTDKDEEVEKAEKYYAKECSKLCVKEILKAIEYSRNSEEHLNYWKLVAKEIEKL